MTHRFAVWEHPASPDKVEASLELVYVADFARMKDASEADKLIYSAADARFIAQYGQLFCAWEGLATVVRGLSDRSDLFRALRLVPDPRIVLAQTVGFSATSAQILLWTVDAGDSTDAVQWASPDAVARALTS